MTTPSSAAGPASSPHWRGYDPIRRADTGSSGGLSAGKIFGIAITLDWSVLLIFAVIAVNLAMGLFPSWHPDWPPPLVWGVALGAACLFFLSVLVHELSHALVARRRGVAVHRITLFVFGGVAQLDSEPDSPWSEFLIAAVGPLTSLLIGLGAAFLGARFAGVELAQAASQQDPLAMRSALEHVHPLATLLLWLGPVNIMLAVFNMIPGFPLDGGRVLRSLLWALTGDLRRATRWASMAGQVVAWGLMIVGLMQVFHGELGAGLWLVLIGWFLHNAARASYQELLQRRALEGVSVADVMRVRFDRVPPDLSLAVFLREHLLASDQRLFPVERDGRWLGVVCVEDVRSLPPSDWSRVTVRELMIPLARVQGPLPGDTADQALKQLRQRGVEQLLVVDRGQVQGLIVRGDLLRWMALHSEPWNSRVSAARRAHVSGSHAG